MYHNFWLAKPYGLAKYGLANQKLCYIPICKSWEKDKECSWEWLVNTDPGQMMLWKAFHLRVFETKDHLGACQGCIHVQM